MEIKKIILGMAIVFSFIFNANSQHKKHYQEHHVQDHKQNKKTLRYDNNIHNSKSFPHHSYHKQHTHYAPVCSSQPIANIRSHHHKSKYWIEGFHSYIPHHGYVWNNGYYTTATRGRVWVPTKFFQSGPHHRFQKIPGHYIYI